MKYIPKGVGTALATPFTEDKKIDFNALTALVEHVINGGVDFLVVLGTTAEAVTLDNTETQMLINHIKDTNNNRLPIFIGIGGNNTKAVVDTIKNTDFIGISGILSVSPYYNKPSQDGIYNHFKAISDVSPVPIIVYNVPGRTASNISAETVIKMANNLDNVVAVKEAAGDIKQAMHIIKNKPKGFSVLSGDDDMVLPFVAQGGDGVISVVANAFPGEFSTMVKNIKDAKLNDAQSIHYQLLDIIEMLFAEGNPSGIKAALKIINIFKTDKLRDPLTPVSKELYYKMESAINNI